MLTLPILLALVTYQAPADAKPASPITVFLVGDSTVRNGSGKGERKLWGWGNFLAAHLDPAKAVVSNRALGGRSSRTFRTEGLWDKTLGEIKLGDVVLIQFGHNDGGPIDTGRARASLKGAGDETKQVTLEATGKAEIVHTYGWYLRQMAREAKAKGATPIILSPVPRNLWSDQGKVARASKDYGKWAGEVARDEGISFVDLNELVATRYEAEGKEKVAGYFTLTDHTHTLEAGARLNAACLAEGLLAVPDGTIFKAVRRTPK